jgi:hypothetical protein
MGLGFCAGLVLTRRRRHTTKRAGKSDTKRSRKKFERKNGFMREILIGEDEKKI